LVREICRDVLFLKRKSTPVSPCKEDISVAQDLLDTLAANRERCVGMAANMIGVNKNIIAVTVGFFNIAMLNPKIVAKKGEYETEEGCLSLDGVRKTKRYKEIEVEYFDMNFKKQRKKYTDFTAEIIQHEIDHLSGIII
jgi:peptide deformylase